MGNDQDATTPLLDITRAPLGELVASRLVEAVAAGDDRLERHYLEIKSDLDLSRKNDVAKIAKYILGSANRLPAIAASAFEGYGVMVIGVAPGAIRGVPPIEILEIDKTVRQYLGAGGPHWDLVRVPAPDSENEVLVIVVDPPKDGQPPFPCRKDGEGLADGRIYVRADGETREAKADELELLFKRSQQSPPLDVGFDVTIEGLAHPMELDALHSLEAHITQTRTRLLEALPKPIWAPEKPAPQASLEENDTHPRKVGATSIPVTGFSPSTVNALLATARETQQLMMSSLLSTQPETRTEEQYRNSIDNWEARFRERWPQAIDSLVGRLLQGISIRVENLSKTFFHDVEVRIHLEGDVRGVERIEDDRIELPGLELPNAPRSWGPTTRPLIDSRMIGTPYVPSPYLPSSYRSPLDWHNSGSIDLRLDVGELRPREEYLFDEREIVLVLPATARTPVSGTWEITARDHNEIYTGTLEVQLGDPTDLTKVFRKIFELDE